MSTEREEWVCENCGNDNYRKRGACSSCNFPRSFKPIDRLELLERLHQMVNGNMQESHMEADALLLRYINDREIAEAFAAIDKWYS